MQRQIEKLNAAEIDSLDIQMNYYFINALQNFFHHIVQHHVRERDKDLMQQVISIPQHDYIAQGEVI